MVSCGDDDEPSGGSTTSGGSSSGGSSSNGNHEWVDLGLTSGTLWATCNVGATSPYEAGDYFAWGETVPKQDYSWASYKWYNTVTGKVTKYSPDVDNKQELDTSDDAAYVNWGSKWRMPTVAQFNELKEECTWQWNGSGYLLTSKKNGKTLILPAVGYRGRGSLYESGSDGYYWSRTLSTVYSTSARHLLFYASNAAYVDLTGRNFGQSVRAVRVS